MKLIVTFRSFAKAPKTCSRLVCNECIFYIFVHLVPYRERHELHYKEREFYYIAYNRNLCPKFAISSLGPKSWQCTYNVILRRF